MKRIAHLTPFLAVMLVVVAALFLTPALAAGGTEDNYREVLNTVRNIGSETADTTLWFATTAFKVIFYALTLMALLWGLMMRSVGNRQWGVWVTGALIAIIGYSLGVPFLNSLLGGAPSTGP